MVRIPSAWTIISYSPGVNSRQCNLHSSRGDIVQCCRVHPVEPCLSWCMVPHVDLCSSNSSPVPASRIIPSPVVGGPSDVLHQGGLVVSPLTGQTVLSRIFVSPTQSDLKIIGCQVVESCIPPPTEYHAAPLVIPPWLCKFIYWRVTAWVEGFDILGWLLA